ncbi:hypothetical protein EYZ11_004112 [Aspergillus tanneri]|uniref:Uncharacterized protein n=1 Tax=Aspergillus tanneri TaxID=1220188 RepID=A0A4S3JLT4_9EURO|nr:hypothetical protein EYZ11_004112 [Aspergillus tanneri]
MALFTKGLVWNTIKINLKSHT